MIIIINGYPTSGKDTLCEIAEEKFNVINYSTVDTVKDIASDMGWNGEKTPENRAMLSALKDFYTNWFDGPFKEMINIIKYEHIENDWADFIFFHIREPDEILRIEEWCEENAVEYYSLFIRRKSVEGEQSNHADSEVENHIYSCYLNNNGTLDEFRTLTFAFLDDLLDGKVKKYMEWTDE